MKEKYLLLYCDVGWEVAFNTLPSDTTSNVG